MKKLVYVLNYFKIRDNGQSTDALTATNQKNVLTATTCFKVSTLIRSQR